jgi:hypothetical protein
MLINEIKPNPNNPRLIKDHKFKQLVKSIQDFPQMLELRPIVIDENNMVLGGNMRLKACIEAGLTDVPVIHANNLSEEKKKEFIVKDNVGYGEWDWDDLANNLDTIKQFDFYGGEPFMSKKMWEILRICVDKGYSKDIELHYNTNGTTWPDEQIKAWSSFKQVNLSFSIDGTDEQFEYMRYPAKWNQCYQNLKKDQEMGNTISLSISHTVSFFNVYYFDRNTCI